MTNAIATQVYTVKYGYSLATRCIRRDATLSVNRFNDISNVPAMIYST